MSKKINSDDEYSDVDEMTLDQDNFLKDDSIVTKYQTAGTIANQALKVVAEACVDGAKVLDLCRLGDETLEKLAQPVYKNSKHKGVAFPTSVSVGNIICHLSPLPSDAEANLTLKDGDFVRIELGAHVDGFIGQVAQTIVVGASKDKPVTGRQADVLQAAQVAADVALRMLKTSNGFSNWDLSDTVALAVKDFNCNLVEGMLSHELRRNTLDGEKSILFNPASDAQRRDIPSISFDEGEAWCVDILVSTGEGKAVTKETRTTIFKRNAAQTYSLKMKTSREVLSEINKRFGELGFSLRSMEDERKARMGIVECQSHALVTPYPVLFEKDPEAHVAHIMFTVLLMPSGPLKITGTGVGACGVVDLGHVKSELQPKDSKVKEILSQGLKNTGGKKKKKSKAKDVAEVANGVAKMEVK